MILVLCSVIIYCFMMAPNCTGFSCFTRQCYPTRVSLVSPRSVTPHGFLLFHQAVLPHLAAEEFAHTQNIVKEFGAGIG